MRKRSIPNAQILVQGGPDRDMSIPTENRRADDWEIYTELESIARDVLADSREAVHVGEVGNSNDAMSLLARSDSQTDMTLNELNRRLKQVKPEIKGVRVVGIRTIRLDAR